MGSNAIIKMVGWKLSKYQRYKSSNLKNVDIFFTSYVAITINIMLMPILVMTRYNIPAIGEDDIIPAAEMILPIFPFLEDGVIKTDIGFYANDFNR